MASGTANVANNDAVHLSLAGNTVRQKGSERQRSHVAKSLAQLFAEALRLPRPIILSTITINTLSLALPLTVLMVFDTVLNSANYLTLTVLLAGLVCAIVAEMRLRLSRDRLFSDFTAKECLELQMQAARALLNSTYFAAMRLAPAMAGDAMRAVGELSRFHSSHARLALLELPFIALYLLAMMFIGGAIIIAPIILTILFVLWTLHSRAALKPTAREQRNKDRERFGLYSQGIDSILTVKALAIEPQLQRRLERIIRDGAPSRYEHILQKSCLASVGQFFETLTFLLLITVGGMMAAKGMISIGEVAASSLIGLLAAQSVRRILGVWEQAEAIREAQLRSEAVTRLPGRATGEMGMSAPAKIQLNGLSLAYDGRPETGQGINLTVGPGEVIGLAIHDDRQHQAMADILRCRIAPDCGECLIDGQKISEEQDAALQRVMFVDEKPAIFRGSIAENMSLFGSVNPAAAIELAQRLDVETDIQKLPDGYCTRLEPDRAADLPRDLLVAISLVRIAAIRPRLLIIDMHRLKSSGISMRACRNMIEALRGATTIVILGRTLTELNGNGRNYRVTNWSLEPVDPNHPDTDEYPDAPGGDE